MNLAELRALVASGRFEQAAPLVEALLNQAAGDPLLWQLRAFVALNRGQPQAALRSLERAVQLKPQSANLLTQLGEVLATVGELKEAEAVLHRAYRIDPQGRKAILALAAVLRDLGKLDEAAMLARRLAGQDDGDAAGWRLLGELALRKGDSAAAVRAFERAVRLLPDDARLAWQLGLAHAAGHGLSAARDLCAQALALDPKFHPALVDLIQLQRRLGDWRGLDELEARLLELVRLGLPGPRLAVLYACTGDPQLQLAAARVAARAVERGAADLPRPQLRAAPRHGPAVPLRVGLIGCSFGDQPLARAIVEVLERLKALPVELTLFAPDGSDDSEVRLRLRALWPVVDLGHWPPARAAQRIADAGLHVLVDLGSTVAGATDTLLALRPCPLQLGWLGRAGSSGAPWLDALLADPVALPAACHSDFSERIVYLPTCLLPLDTRAARAPRLDRAELGLPPQGFVFGSFGDPAKLSGQVFDAWARILLGAPQAWLWLGCGDEPDSTATHLRRELAARGVAPERLLPALPAAHPERLARLAEVGLLLDPWPQGSRFGAADAIASGCPVLTLPGRALAGRHAASLNAYLGLTDLNCSSVDQYVEIAIAIARNPAAADVLRETIRQSRGHSSLFDNRLAAQGLYQVLRDLVAQRQG